MRSLKSCFGVPTNSLLYRKTSYRIAISHYRFGMCCVCIRCCIRTKVTICGNWAHVGASHGVHCPWKHSHYIKNNAYPREPQQFHTVSHTFPTFYAFGHLTPEESSHHQQPVSVTADSLGTKPQGLLLDLRQPLWMGNCWQGHRCLPQR